MLKALKLSRKDISGSKLNSKSTGISSPSKEQNNPVKNLKSPRITGSLSKSFTAESPKLVKRSSKHNSNNLSSPEKVIKALSTRLASSPKELSYVKGEFFHVVSESERSYKAINPITGVKGRVPKSQFKVFGRSTPKLPRSKSLSNNMANTPDIDVNILRRMGVLYAVVLYDFEAEKSDELTSHSGEILCICAHHNYEWFIAKPIHRLGKPGLVPVNYVSIIDIDTEYATNNDVEDDIASVNLPTVPEWKENIAKYNSNKIILGSVEYASIVDPTLLTPETIIYVAVSSLTYEEGNYWFQVECTFSDRSVRTLKRYYKDFSELQIKLSDSYPADYGKLRDSDGNWTESIAYERKKELNIYLNELINLPEHIATSPAIFDFFSLRDNNFDEEVFKNEQSYEEENNSVESHKAATVTNSSRIFEPNKTSHIFCKGSDSGTNNFIFEGSDNILTGEDLKLFERLSEISIANSLPILPGADSPEEKVKVKFNYKDDIFALRLSSKTTVQGLKNKIIPRIDTDNFKLFVKGTNGDGKEIKSDIQVSNVIKEKLKITVRDF